MNGFIMMELTVVTIIGMFLLGQFYAALHATSHILHKFRLGQLDP